MTSNRKLKTSPMPSSFSLLATVGGARRGRLRTAHGAVETPAFMPVGTQGTVKAATPAQLREVGAQIILSNTYHLNLRPGPALIRELGGLHKFMAWDGPILTDSGGFQVFSLAKLRKISDDGVAFRSHLDGAEIFLGPRECMNIQAALGSDIAMVLDECPPWPAPEEDVRAAVARTLRWAKTCREVWHELGQPEQGRQLFAIVQGSSFAELRRECAEALAALDFPGYAIGGVSVGEPELEMLAAVAAATPYLPADKPRYVMGVGTPPQLLRMIALGVDLFDCGLRTVLQAPPESESLKQRRDLTVASRQRILFRSFSTALSIALTPGSRSKFWRMKPSSESRKREASRSESEETSRPPIRTWPLVGASSVATINSSVVLPEPQGP